MKTRIASVDYKTFLLCYKYSLWGANNVYLSKWEVGDQLVFKVGGKILALAEINGEAYMDDTIIWDNGLFWNRLPIKFKKILSPNNGIDFNQVFRPKFIKLWGKNYGWVILNKSPLNREIEIELLNAFEQYTDESNYYIDVDTLISNIE